MKVSSFDVLSAIIIEEHKLYSLQMIIKSFSSTFLLRYKTKVNPLETVYDHPRRRGCVLQSIVRAHESVVPGRLHVSSGELLGASINR